jgi:hypothetical protein
MRRAVFLGLIAAFSVAGAAYGAATVTNVYTWHARIRPVKSGTKAHPIPAGGHFAFTVTTTPSGQRPNIVKTISIRFQGIRENTNRFAACGTARLMNPGEGPTTCPTKSKIATGYFIAEISKQGDQSPSGIVLTCRVELTIYNGGDHTLTYWVYKGTPPSGQTECPLPRNEAFVAALTKTAKGLVNTFTLPEDLRHPVVAGTTYDAAVVKGVANVSIVKKRKHGKTIGLFPSTFCPANHKRQIAITFTQENGGSRTATRLTACHY